MKAMYSSFFAHFVCLFVCLLFGCGYNGAMGDVMRDDGPHKDIGFLHNAAFITCMIHQREDINIVWDDRLRHVQY